MALSKGEKALLVFTLQAVRQVGGDVFYDGKELQLHCQGGTSKAGLEYVVKVTKKEAMELGL